MKTVKRTSTFVALIAAMSVIGLLIAPATSLAAIPIHFWEGGVGTFNQFTATALDPIFAPPGFSDFTDDVYNPLFDWTGSFTSPNLIGATGATREEMIFTISFDEAFSTTPFSFEFYGYDNGILRDWTTISYNGQGMVDLSTYENWTFEFHAPSPVPEPSTIFLLGAGLVGLIGFARKSRP